MARVRAPEFPTENVTWLNTAGPLTLAGLSGRLVVLDFWTFCCINCLHILPTLRRIEEAFPDTVAVIGVHSPKFTAEKDLANLREAVLRHDIRHPVLQDAGMQTWQRYAVRAWPTLVLVSPDGYVLAQVAGEPDPEGLMMAVGQLVSEYAGAGLIRPRPLDLQPPAAPSGRLAFPGKIKPIPPRPGDPARWAIADGGHHQIVLLDEMGREVARFGSGQRGRVDGPASEAAFAAPQGLDADDSSIWVADTCSHALRRIDRASGLVTTVAGDGRRGMPLGPSARPGGAVALASPWDVAVTPAGIAFANAGTHQLGLYAPEPGIVAGLAGSGREDILDGPAAEAALAQPSGLAFDPASGRLWFADSETSSIRAFSFATGAVDTLLGAGLFAFGHVNGPLERARLQHALGLVLDDQGRVLVADSYNHRVRVLDPRAGLASDLDDGFTCTDPVCLPLAEPAGIAVDGARILVSDTNNHRIVELLPAERLQRTWVQ